MPPIDQTQQITQLLTALSTLNPLASDYNEQRQQLIAQLDTLQNQRLENFALSNTQNTERDNGPTQQISGDGAIQNLWQKLNNLVSMAFAPTATNCVEADAAKVTGAAGEAGDIAVEATAMAGFHPGAMQVSMAAKEIAGELYSYAMELNERGIADKKYQKESNKAALPAE